MFEKKTLIAISGSHIAEIGSMASVATVNHSKGPSSVVGFSSEKAHDGKSVACALLTTGEKVMYARTAKGWSVDHYESRITRNGLKYSRESEDSHPAHAEVAMIGAVGLTDNCAQIFTGSHVVICGADTRLCLAGGGYCYAREAGGLVVNTSYGPEQVKEIKRVSGELFTIKLTMVHMVLANGIWFMDDEGDREQTSQVTTPPGV